MEAVQEQSTAQSAAPPGTADTQHADPAERLVSASRRAGEQDACELVSVLREEPEVGVERLAEAPVTPLLVAQRLVVVLVGEGLLLDRIDASVVLARPERAHPDPLGPGR